MIVVLDNCRLVGNCFIIITLIDLNLTLAENEELGSTGNCLPIGNNVEP